MVLAILLLALVLRLILVNQSLWLDEAIQILAVKNTQYLALINQYSLGDFHPPLFHLVLKFWTEISGISEVAARSLSVLSGVGTVLVVFLIGKEIKNQKLGLIAALFLAAAPLHIYYSQEARMYVLAAFFVATTVYFFIKVLKTGKLIYWFFLTLSLILTLYSDYLPYLILIPLNLYVLTQLKKLKTRFLIKWVVSQLIALIFLLPWLPFFTKQVVIGVQAAENLVWKEVVGGFALKAIPVTAAKFIGGRISSFNKVFYGGILVLPFIYFSFLFLKSLFAKEKEKILLLFWLTLPILTGWIISIFLPVFSYFRFLFTLPAMYLIIGLGILSFKNLKLQTTLISLVLVINLIFLSIFWVNPRFWREDWRSAVSYIETNSSQNSAAVFVNLDQTAPYIYYAQSVPVLGPNGWQDKNLQTLWLSRYVQPIFDPEDRLRKEIESAGFVKIEERDFNGVTFWRYQRIYANCNQCFWPFLIDL